MRSFTVQQRRRDLVARHHLAGDAAGPDAVVRALIALHATDPASVYLSVLARSSTSTLADVAHSLYETRSLVRWLAMRRTVFVLARDDIPIVQAAVSTTIASSLRTQLINRLRAAGSDPPITDDVSDWLTDTGDRTVDALRRRGAATGAQLAADEPRLRTRILARSASEGSQNLTTRLLTVLGADGRIIRGDPTGAWTSRQHLWEPVERQWPRGMVSVDAVDARTILAGRWLERFGPASVEDLQWWTGWTKSATRQALESLPVEEIDLHGRPGIALREAEDRTVGNSGDAVAPVAALLPALDPTPMGWKHRAWFFDIDQSQVFDRSGNIGPTVWWDGRIVGSWSIADTGEIRTGLLADHGQDAAAAIQGAAEALQSRLAGTVVTPAVRTPLERALTATPQGDPSANS